MTIEQSDMDDQNAGDAPSTRVVELTVGDATLECAPDQIAGIVEQPVS